VSVNAFRRHSGSMDRDCGGRKPYDRESEEVHRPWYCEGKAGDGQNAVRIGESVAKRASEDVAGTKLQTVCSCGLTDAYAR